VPEEVTIREAVSLEDIYALSAVFEAVWGAEGVPAANVSRAIQHAGGYLALAERGDQVVGASLGFLGRHGDVPLLHSHITGTLPGEDNRGIGFVLKQHQRTWCLDRGIETITWTFDPLVRRNAYFNLTKLGALATEYHPDFYGDMGDALNAGDESDRIVATWHLTTPRPVDRDVPADATFVLDIGESGEPVITEGAGATLLHRVPADVPDGARKRAWRHAVRKTLGAAIADGYIGTGVTTDGWYVLRQP